MSAIKRFGNIIGGEAVDATEATIDINPSDTDDVVGEFVRASLADLDDAVAAARSIAPEWAAVVPGARHDILRRAADEVLQRKGELGALLSREEGKTLAEGVGEVTRAGQVLAFFAGECLRAGGELIPSVRAGVGVEVSREPLGVVGVITPWNFPMAIPAWKIAPALAYGNTVVLKPAALVPASAWELVDILQRAGLPAGALNLIMGSGAVLGPALVEHPDVDAITFTGSVPVGRGIATACVTGRTMKKMQLEMGGKNPLVILDDAELDTAVECAVNGAYFSTGQRCTASSRLIVTEGIHDRFVERFYDRMEKLTVDDALKSSTDIGPMVSEEQLTKNLAYIDIGRDEGATLCRGGKRLKRETNGHYLEPALFVDGHNSMRIAREEIFGPVAVVLRARDYDDALAIANDTDFGLSAGICTTSLKYAADFRKNIRSGLAMVNLATAGLDFHVPFGGTRASSYGPREQGRYPVEFYTTIKTSYIAAG